MTVEDFDSIEDGDNIISTNPVTGYVRKGKAKRLARDEIEINWGADKMKILRHQVRSYQYIYETFTVEKQNATTRKPQ